MPYTLQGQPLQVAHEPQLKDGTLWVPFRAIGIALGGNVDWDPDQRMAILYLGPYTTTIRIGDKTADVDGEKVELQDEPYLDEGDTWVPVRFFERPLGYKVNADWQNKQVDITNPAAV